MTRATMTGTIPDTDIVLENEPCTIIQHAYIPVRGRPTSRIRFHRKIDEHESVNATWWVYQSQLNFEPWWEA